MDPWAPDACTLPTAEVPLRVAEFDDLLAGTLREVTRLGPTRLRWRLAGGPDLAGRVRDLLARESACCSFFTFTVTGPASNVLVDAEVPAAQTGVLDALAERAAALIGTRL